MTGILAIDTATEACSVALWRNGHIEERHELAARQHNRRIFAMLDELLPDGGLRQQGIDAIAWGCGPGSFTGLRIAAAAVQGLAFTSDLPVVSVSTLACQAQTACRLGIVGEGEYVLSTLDARINEVYAAVYQIRSGLPAALVETVACAPAEVNVPAEIEALTAIGTGCEFVDDFPLTLRARIATSHPDLLPHARDLVPLGQARLAAGDTQTGSEVQPVYVRDEINWKKIPQQGKRS